MATQIFIEPELENLHEYAEQWEQLCSDLQLKHQLKKIGKAERLPNPYMRLDPRTERVYELICPRKELYTDYKAGT